MITIAYKVGGWVWRNAYVIIRITKNEIPEKDQIDLAIFEVQIVTNLTTFLISIKRNSIYNFNFLQESVKHIFENEFKLKFFEFLKVSKSQKNFFLYSNTYILKKNQHFLYISALALKKWLTQFLVARAEINISLVFRSI